MRVCRRCGQECAGARGLVAHDCPETIPKGSLEWHFIAKTDKAENYVELTPAG